MTRKKTTEAVSVSSPQTSASVPVEKKSRAKSVTASSKAAPEKVELVSKPVHKRRVGAEASAVVAPTAKKPVSKLTEAVVMKHELRQEDISIGAYFNWLDRGCPHDTSGEDWFRAESELGGKAKAAGA